MLTKDELQNALNNQYTQFKTDLDEMKTDIINTISKDNEALSNRVTVRGKTIELEKAIQSNLHYQRNCNVIISGIPSSIGHKNLELLVIKMFNLVCFHQITTRDLMGVHRISAKSNNVLIKFVNSKDAIALLDRNLSLKSLTKETLEIEQSEKIKLSVSEHLTPYISNLAYICRTLKREGKLIKTKTQKGMSKALHSAYRGISKWYDILHINDLTNINPEFSAVPTV